ncbi:MAG: multidrug transporter [Ruminococcaceae bacterium]|nr:multidrug transporter [Oscillospiraceae bacterium]
MMNISEKDWKLFKEKLPLWQERYIEKLNSEYIQILNSKENPSEKFWILENKIKTDRRKAGVIVEMSRKNMLPTLWELMSDNAISKTDLIEFSDDVKHKITYFLEL